MSQEHFALECSANGCLLRDLNSTNGTTVNGNRVSQSALNDGDVILAGESRFSVSISGAKGATPAAWGSDSESTDIPEITKEQVLEYFRQTGEPLFAIVDAARDPMILALLAQSDTENQSLYAGPNGAKLAAVAPYLVRLPSDCSLLKSLVEHGWGENWGVFLTCNQPFSDVRKHLRRFLMVQNDEGKKVYFRFYDPRILRVFLPTCLPGQAAEFFGPISSFFAEDETAKQLLRFASASGGQMETVRMTDDAVSATVQK